MLKVNLGCNDNLRSGYLNVDCVHPFPVGIIDQNFIIADLRKRWPWNDGIVDEVFAHDVFEHLDNREFPGQKGIIWCMNEAHRVLKPGGILDLYVPCLPGVAPWVDPSHVSVWTADLRYYFDERWNNPKGERGRLGPGMGITALFKTLPNGRSGEDWVPIQYAPDAPDRSKLMLMLEAVK